LALLIDENLRAVLVECGTPSELQSLVIYLPL
jgi:hypothetical protein